MKRVTMKVTGTVSFNLDDGDGIDEKLQKVTLDKILDSKEIDSEEIAVEDNEWALFYHKATGVLLQLVEGDGSNLDDSEFGDGMFINDAWCPFDTDVIGTCYYIDDALVQAIKAGKYIVDGGWIDALFIDGTRVDTPNEPVIIDGSKITLDDWTGTQWTNYKEKMGDVSSKTCLTGYLDLCGFNSTADEWELVAKG